MKNILVALSAIALVAPAAASAVSVSNPTCCIEATPVNLPTPSPVPQPGPTPSAPSLGAGAGMPLPSARELMTKPVFVSDELWASLTDAQKLNF